MLLWLLCFSLCPPLVSKGKFLPSSRFLLCFPNGALCGNASYVQWHTTEFYAWSLLKHRRKKQNKTRNWFPVLFKGLCSSFLDNTTTYALRKTRSQQDSLLIWAADSAVKCGKTATGLWRVCFQKQGFPRSAWQLWLKHVYSSCINCQMIFKAI